MPGLMASSVSSNFEDKHGLFCHVEMKTVQQFWLLCEAKSGPLNDLLAITIPFQLTIP